MAELKIQFLDVGQGDGIFIQFPGGATMLVDLGSTKNKVLVSTDILQYFKAHTKFANPGETLDYLILTHADRDHYNMVLEFIKGLNVKVARLMHGGLPGEYKIPKQTDGSKATNLIAKIAELCPGVVQVKATGSFPFPLKHAGFGRAGVHVLAANTPATSHSDEGWRKNTASIVLMLTYGKARVILAGDATADTETFVRGLFKLSRSALSSHVLKVGHHGSHRTSNTVPWIQAVRPEFVFISSDRHGFLDEDQKPTGHRLPQTLTLDLIQKHSGFLYDQCVAHNVISAFDSDDYAAYNKNPDVDKDVVAVVGQGKEWRETATQLGIFTSLVKMDDTQSDASEADQGAQYQLSISEQSVLDITSTWGTGHLASVQLK